MAPPTTLPRHSTNASKRERSRASSLHSASVPRLSIIEEDAANIPPIPPKAHHRPFHRRWNLGEPPRFSFETPPPKYSLWDATKGPKGEKLADVRNNKHIARRGGWRRICLIALLLVASIVALAVGLAVGLNRKNSQKSQTSTLPLASSSDNNDTNESFPAGSYTLPTFLTTTNQSCTSQPDYWSCWPYHTYTPSTASESVANFTVTIAPSPQSSPSNLTISNKNTFSLAFDPVPLTLLNAGTDDEHYAFTATLDKSTTPSLGLECDFNGTTLTGSLYTKKPPTLGSQSQGGNGGKDFSPYPYAVEISQTIAGGGNTPKCWRVLQDGRRGDRVVAGLVARPSSSLCECGYRNF
ncbi:hypothetical protein Q9189_003900 [Teloschistes chrysophthalmus]